MKFIYYSLYHFYTKIPIIGNNINIYVTGAISLLILSPFFAIYNIYNYERYGRLQYDLFTLLIPYCIIYKLLYNYYEQRGDKIVVRIDKQYNRKKNIIITLSWIVIGILIYLWVFDGAYTIYNYSFHKLF